MIILETTRLILREFEDTDLDALLKINQDKNVMAYFPGTQNLEQTQNFIKKVKQHFSEHGYSLYAVELRNTGEYIGFVGLLNATFKAHFTPATEIGWRIAYKHWGKGYATEAAKAILHYAFTDLKIAEVVSFTSKTNIKSRRVMEKIGLIYKRDDDFINPNIPDDYPDLKPHVLYRLKHSDYNADKV